MSSCVTISDHRCHHQQTQENGAQGTGESHPTGKVDSDVSYSLFYFLNNIFHLISTQKNSGFRNLSHIRTPSPNFWNVCM